jgi:hypothetical protein
VLVLLVYLAGRLISAWSQIDMPLASLASLMWYGAGAAAAVGNTNVSASASIKANGRLDGVNTSVATSPRAIMTKGLKAAAVGTTTVSASASIKGKGRISAIGKVNELSQDDVTGAILESIIEPGLTLRQALRLVVAAQAGKVSGAATTTVTIKNAVADNKNRIVATVDADGNRTAITYDLT